MDSDIARAWTLPSYLYTEAAAFAAEKERIFGRSWQVVGHRDRVANAGTTSRQSWPGSLC